MSRLLDDLSTQPTRILTPKNSAATTGRRVRRSSDFSGRGGPWLGEQLFPFSSGMGTSLSRLKLVQVPQNPVWGGLGPMSKSGDHAHLVESNPGDCGRF